MDYFAELEAKYRDNGLVANLLDIMKEISNIITFKVTEKNLLEIYGFFSF